MHLDTAIQKSRIEEEIWIYRGVLDISWLNNSQIGGIFTEKAFGSFSIDISHAYQYTNLEKPIIFQIKLNSEMRALYIDKAENEILRPREITYRIVDKRIEKVKGINNEIEIFIIEEVWSD
ncbi:hypothetical protein MmiHf6_01850 [Methanimicrococcus hongohii]|uniref:ADP ribosyltransferase domain-containing protein n=2 Tax=Methanimicrococcus hongohii TaxID=3028295 RepID=A0AA96V0T1_9EURY|nr:hypothetical protein MmiHf6_01850 [Methanimicrococcus sp. Hf6]